MANQIDKLKTILTNAVELSSSVEETNTQLLKDNMNLKRDLKDMKVKYRVLKNQINKTLNPIDTKYDFTNAPNFLKVLQNIESIEGMERYILQLGCFVTNTRLENQLVINGPGPSGKTVMARIATMLNKYAEWMSSSWYFSDDSYNFYKQGIPKFIDIKHGGDAVYKPFILNDVGEKQLIESCLKYTKSKLDKIRLYIKHNSYHVRLHKLSSSRHHCIGVRSPMILCTNIDNFESEDCDIVRTEFIKSEDMDGNLINNLKREIEEIRSICMQVYEKNKDKIITS